jgi:hypothetical protein
MNKKLSLAIISIVLVASIASVAIRLKPSRKITPYELEQQLSWESGSGRPLHNPSETEQAAAAGTLANWNKFGIAEKNERAVDLIAGKALIGLDKKEIQTNMGLPAEFYTVQPNQWCFDCTLDEDWRYVIVRFDKDKVKDAFLMVNY